MQPKFRDILREPEFARVVTSEVRNYQSGEVIVEEDTSGDEIFLILKGTAEVYAAVDHLGTPGRKTGIAKLTEGNVIGELSVLFEDQPRTASVIATSNCEIAAMDSRSLAAYMDAHPAQGYWILKDVFTQLVGRMRQATLRSNTIMALYLNDCE
jgi:CRP-like cAMP-binding protein